MTPHVRIRVAGALPRSVTQAIRDRFGIVSIRQRNLPPPPATVLDLRCADQPALRALLTLIWDVGSDVLSLTTTEEDPS